MSQKQGRGVTSPPTEEGEQLLRYCRKGGREFRSEFKPGKEGRVIAKCL